MIQPDQQSFLQVGWRYLSERNWDLAAFCFRKCLERCPADPLAADGLRQAEGGRTAGVATGIPTIIPQPMESPAPRSRAHESLTGPDARETSEDWPDTATDLTRRIAALVEGPAPFYHWTHSGPEACARLATSRARKEWGYEPDQRWVDEVANQSDAPGSPACSESSRAAATCGA